MELAVWDDASNDATGLVGRSENLAGAVEKVCEDFTCIIQYYLIPATVCTFSLAALFLKPVIYQVTKGHLQGQTLKAFLKT